MQLRVSACCRTCQSWSAASFKHTRLLHAMHSRRQQLLLASHCACNVQFTPSSCRTLHINRPISETSSNRFCIVGRRWGRWFDKGSTECGSQCSMGVRTDNVELRWRHSMSSPTPDVTPTHLDHFLRTNARSTRHSLPCINTPVPRRLLLSNSNSCWLKKNSTPRLSIPLPILCAAAPTYERWYTAQSLKADFNTNHVPFAQKLTAKCCLQYRKWVCQPCQVKSSAGKTWPSCKASAIYRSGKALWMIAQDQNPHQSQILSHLIKSFSHGQHFLKCRADTLHLRTTSLYRASDCGPVQWQLQYLVQPPIHPHTPFSPCQCWQTVFLWHSREVGKHHKPQMHNTLRHRSQIGRPDRSQACGCRPAQELWQQCVHQQNWKWWPWSTSSRSRTAGSSADPRRGNVKSDWEICRRQLITIDAPTLLELERLHPQQERPHTTAFTTHLQPDSRSDRFVEDIIMSFNPMASNRPSGLKPDHLNEARLWGTALEHEELCKPISVRLCTILHRQVSRETMKPLSASTLCAYRKKDAGLPPVACGDVLQRVIGNVFVGSRHQPWEMNWQNLKVVSELLQHAKNHFLHYSKSLIKTQDQQYYWLTLGMQSTTLNVKMQWNQCIGDSIG